MQKLINRLKKIQLGRKHYILSVAILLLITIKLWYILLLPDTLFDVPYSTVVEDENSILLSAIIADDGQWRFPQSSEVPEKFKICITEFEDSKFRWHPGVNIFSLLRAAYLNIKTGKIVSGGSTITMQVIRLSRNDKPRTLWEKLIEIIYATRLEFSYSKSEILNIYSSHAPFGGNVVGLEAASWRYYGIAPEQLSWGQAATLAVLPNAPSLIYPGKNEEILLKKRNKLLKKLLDKGYFSSDVYESTISEPLPGKPKQLPSEGVHIMNRVISDGMKGQRVQTTIRHEVQEFVQNAVNKHVEILSGNKVYNAAAIVIDVESGAIVAYVGNSTNSDEHQNQVDVINSPRSPGSTLKPFLYCAMIHEGIILPDAIMPDIPMILDGFNPQNYNRTYDGAVPASMALSRSLNVPAVHMLKMYGIGKFHLFLQKAGFTTFTQSPSWYGLSIILGGAEVKLHELTGVYASMARILIRYGEDQSYSDEDIFAPYYIKSDKKPQSAGDVFTSSSAIWHTFKAMVEVNRPEEDQFWFHFSSRSPVAWKTGTSYGERDAWAVGVTPGYVVGVWAGNTTGEGRPGLTGLLSAAPLMFEILDYLPRSAWFQEPVNEMIPLNVCSKSGYKASPLCEETYVQKVPATGFRSKTCPYHKTIHLDLSGQWQVNADCEDIGNIRNVHFYVLPPVMEYYHKIRNPFHASLPPFRADCQSNEGESNFGIIYPVNNSKIYLIDDQSINQGQVVFRAAHRKANAVLHWHLDGEFIGSTSDVHTIAVKPEPGKHKLFVVDHTGETNSCSFEILNKK